MNGDQPYKKFLSLLEQIYGPFNQDRNSFKKASNSIIARELCYSDSQFSRLINNSATQGEYERAIRNVNRALREIQLEKEADKQNTSNGRFNFNKLSFKSVYVLPVLVALIVILVISISWNFMSPTAPPNTDKDSMLHWIFKNSSVSPYVSLNELPLDCDYPCYKYQGQWKLKDSYKIPVFRERNGFHYLAKNVNLFIRCNKEEAAEGRVMEGYEYQEHEIWYDRRELKFDSFLSDTDKTKINDEYRSLQFENDDNYVKIAYIHTFFINEFAFDSTSIKRTGQVVGRDVEFVSDNDLINELGSTEKVADIKKEINSIIINRLNDFSRPISCANSPIPDNNIHNISEGDTMSFDCQLTTANAPIQYTKTYILNDQYIQTSCRTEL